MIAAPKSNGPDNTQGHACHGFGEWHQDCLAATILLAASFGAKSLKKILKKSGHPDEARQADLDLLLGAVHEACRTDPKARAAVEKALNARFSAGVGQVRKMGEDEILAEAKSGRWLVPLLWGCCQSTSSEARRAGRRLAQRIILSGQIRPRATDEMEAARAQIEALTGQNAALSKEMADIKKENNKLGLSLQRLSAKAESTAPAMPAQPIANPHKKQAKQLRKELADARQESETLRQQVAVWRSLALRSGKQGQPPADDKKPANRFPAPDMCGGCGQAGGSCGCERRDECPLSGRKVAVIGGLERLEKGYSQVVEKMGGKCIFHPGHTASGMGRLRKAVSGSDLVVYLTPINSHGAMSVVKKQCKRCNTPFCPLNGTSVSALETHLGELTDIF